MKASLTIIGILVLLLSSCSTYNNKSSYNRSVSSHDLKICINSSIYSGMGALQESYNTEEDEGYDVSKVEKLGIKFFSDFILGHAAIEVKRNNETIRSYGYWPDDNLQINNDDTDGKEEKTTWEENGYKITEFIASECYPVQFSQLEKIEKVALGYIELFGDWSNRNNCVRFAQHVYSEITGIKNLKTLLPLPTSLYKKINKKK